MRELLRSGRNHGLKIFRPRILQPAYQELSSCAVGKFHLSFPGLALAYICLAIPYELVPYPAEPKGSTPPIPVSAPTRSFRFRLGKKLCQASVSCAGRVYGVYSGGILEASKVLRVERG